MNNLKQIAEQIEQIEKIYSKKLKHCSYLQFRNNELILWDKELYFKINCNFDFEFITETEAFLNLYANIKNIDFEIKKNDSSLNLKSTKININLPILNDIQIPDIRVKRMYELQSNFIFLLEECSSSISNNSTDGILNCFLINKNYIIACNNIEATKINLEIPILHRFLIPSSFYKRIKNLKIDFYQIEDNFLTFSCENSIIGTPMINDEFPDFEEYFLQEGISIIITDEFKEMINRVGSLIDTKKEDDCVQIEKKNNDLICSSLKDKGNIVETDSTQILFPNDEKLDLIFKINPIHFTKASDGFKKGHLKDNCILFYKKNLVRILSLIGV